MLQNLRNFFHLRQNGDYTYAYSYVRNDRDQLRVVNWGRCDEGKFIPGKAFLERPDLWNRLDFPADVGISEAEVVVKRMKAEKKDLEREEHNRLYDHSWLTEEAARKMY